MNILYICTPNSIHDQKWMKYFASKEAFNVYAVGESKNTKELEELMKSINIELLPSISSFSIAHPFKNLESIKQLKQYCKDFQIDLVHVLFATPYALWVNYLKTPYVITTRGSDVLVVLPELKKAPLLKRIYFNWLYKQFKKAFSNATHITSTSTLQAAQLKKMFDVESKVIRTGVEVDEINKEETLNYLPEVLKDKQVVFSPRFMSSIYNISYQIDAIKLLSKEIIEKYTFLFIRGKNFDNEYFEIQLARLEKLKQENRLNFVIIDYLSQKELWATFKHAKLTIMTPKSDGTPNSALEAMAAKCPLIVSDLPYDKVLFDNTCTKVKLDDAKDLAKAMEKELTQPPPVEILNQTLNTVKTHGNRPTEMKKLEQLYNAP